MQSAPYDDLDPDTVLHAVERCGHVTNGRLLALNSYENRVYQVGVEDGRPLVVKFYRPGRWSDEAILEEHAFSLELSEREIPVIPPLECDGDTLLQVAGFRYALYPTCGGRWPELATAEERAMVGRFLGRIHMVGSAFPFRDRPTMDIERLGQGSRDWLMERGWIPAHLESAYESVTESVLETIRDRFDTSGDVALIRIHGDCHPGNILWTDDGPHFVDLDDCVNGPSVQDLWMLLSGDRDEMTQQLKDLLDGYRDFAEFDYRELWLVEALRTLRIIHYYAWIARRWGDPAFPMAFPWFSETRTWEEHILTLKEQAAALQEGPLEV